MINEDSNKDAPHQTIFTVKASVHENKDTGKVNAFPTERVNRVFTNYHHNLEEATEIMNKFIKAIEDVAKEIEEEDETSERS